MATKNAIYINDLHFEHVNWMKELRFWEDEIVTYQHRLEELVQRWTDRDVLAKLEHFQNQFILHSEKMDQLKHDVNQHESELANYAKEHPVAINRVHFVDHGGLRDRMRIQRRLIAELKEEFYGFLAKFM